MIGGHRRHPRATAQRLEVVAGILIVFDLVALVSAIVDFARQRGQVQGMAVLVVISTLLYVAVRHREGMRL